MRLPKRVVVSNGSEHLEIEAADLPAAEADGFYRPRDRGLTIVTNGSEILEIPLADLSAAQGDGYRDLVTEVEKPRRKKKSSARRTRKSSQFRFAGLPLLPSVATGDAAIKTGEELPDFKVKSFTLAGVEALSVASREVQLDAGTATPPEAVDAARVTLGEVVDKNELHRQELEQQLNEATGIERLKLLWQLHHPTQEQLREAWRSYGVSVILHVAILLLLSMMLLKEELRETGGALISGVVAASDTFEEQSEDVEIEVQSDSDLDDASSSSASDLAGQLSETLGSAESLNTSFAASAFGGGTEGLSTALGEGLDKLTGESEKTNAAFFGSNQVASRFVFVIDNSLSMTKGRFETALNELAKTIMRLSPRQSFFVIFYSDTAYSIFHPHPADELLPATPRNKQYALQWLSSVELCLRTDCEEALKKAYTLNPDVIFVLGDGAFTDNDKVVNVIRNRSKEDKEIVVHTLGMQVNPDAAAKLKFLATASGGTYHDVGVHPQAAIIAQKNPRPRHRTRGKVWGLKLKP